MFNTHIRPVQRDDLVFLEAWRRLYPHATLDLPHGYSEDSVETVVAEAEDKRLLGSMTGTRVVVVDPYIRNPQAGRIESLESATLMCRHLECEAIKGGARDIYIAISNDDVKWQELVQRLGFSETAPGCRTYRRSL